ncbi:metal ABC transporter permease [Nakamurella sp. A5-74]|uniref:Metal ABC transporter permease n=1 Tax=Nakamurella sp. A5-74 TaxID=3158264 RepID=A0AAU8DQX1_9ACTN
MIDAILQPLQYGFMARAVIVAVIAALVCGVLSCWLVLIGWSLMGDAVSHAVLPGVVLAYITGAPFAVGALVFGVLAVVLIGVVRGTTEVKEDATIGVVFTSLFALGIVLVSVTPSQIDLGHILFGNLLGVGIPDLWQVLIVGGLTLTVLVAKRRDLTLYAFDKTHAHAIGISPQRIGALLLGLLALTVVVALQSVGVVLVVALLITPGATAFLLTRSFFSMLWLSPLISVICAFAGVYISYYLDSSPGGTVVLAMGAMFTLAYLFGPRGLIRRRSRGARIEASLIPTGDR